ncbi:hypothetical protein ONZ45_g18090 [Pleurotus djamor]|nr:hypothetical protein ONZ45_g18090 [Pleurotus djamor]
MRRRPRISKRAKQAASATQKSDEGIGQASSSTVDYSLFPVLNNHGPPPIVHLIDGTKITQSVNLPPLPGQVGFSLGQPNAEPRRCRSPTPTPHEPVEPIEQDLSFPLMSRHRRRKEKQWQVWVGDILPSLLPTYFKLLATTKSLQAEPVLSEPTPCSCEGRIRDLSIVIVRFTDNFADIPSTPQRKRSRTHDSPNSHTTTEGGEVSGENPFNDPPNRERPSDYLRSRCPACFGGKFPRPSLQGPDALVCLDACLAQKRRPSECDPPLMHPRSVFIPESLVNQMDEYITLQRSAHRRGADGDESDDEDRREDGLPISNAVLTGCEKSFTAADESQTKANSQFFDCTALMGLLCRHDRVLWLVNMTSAGEKQHYCYTLLEMLFQHLPSSFSVGILYDIGCQIHRSCVKHGFLSRYVDRIKFGISIFHAFGHQWPCQIAYHPRKVEGFGLTDGEGCERFWKSISGLIAYLRVCGFHRRLYALNAQIHHDDSRSLLQLGSWLSRKQVNCTEKLSEATHTLSQTSSTIPTLRTQWALQVDAQTKPLPRQNKQRGRTAVEEVLSLMKARDALKLRLQRLEDIVTDLDQLDIDIVTAEAELPDARRELADMEGRFRRKREALGVDDASNLRRLISSPFLNLRMNALAVKTRIRDRLRHQRFEIEPIERAGRRQGNADKLRRHTQTAITRREPTIQVLVRKYNTLVDSMARLIRQHQAPRNAQLPSKIPTSGLFELDVDDEISNDVGLLDDEDVPPPWLANEDVRGGIKALLLRDRCKEENSRLTHECWSLREWFSEEWELTQQCLEAYTTDNGLHYQFQLYEKHLINLCATWQKATFWMNIEANIDHQSEWTVEEPEEEDVYSASEGEMEDADFTAALETVYG